MPNDYLNISKSKWGMKKRAFKSTALFCVFLLLNQIVYPTVALALTSGPTQPEVSQFQILGTADMVDLATGDFNYTLPLMDIGGFPINLSYNSEVTMEQEATWVGLGWTLNPGAINRDMRGLPDDFAGDEVTFERSMKENKEVGQTANLSFELFGLDPKETTSYNFNDFGGSYKEITHGDNKGLSSSLNLSFSVKKNSYKGFGFDLGVSPSLAIEAISSHKVDFFDKINFEYAGTHKDVAKTKALGIGLGLNLSSWSGAGVSPSVSLSRSFQNYECQEQSSSGASIGMNIGNQLHQTGMNYSLGGLSGGMSFGMPTHIPTVTFPTVTKGFKWNLGVGPEALGIQASGRLTGYSTSTKLRDNSVTTRAYGYLNEHLGYEREAESKSKGHEWLMDYNREGASPSTPDAQTLPLPNHTYDKFIITGGGSFRAYRNDVGFLHDPDLSKTSIGVNGSFGFDAGLSVKAGVSGLGGTFTSTEVGKWFPEGHLVFPGVSHGVEAAFNLDASLAFDNMDFESDSKRQNTNPNYNSAYFRDVSEFSGTNAAFREAWADDDLSRVKLKRVVGGLVPFSTLSNELESEDELNGALSGKGSFDAAKQYVDDKTPTAQQIAYLTAVEAKLAGLDREIVTVPKGKYSWERDFLIKEPRVDDKKKKHHISEIKVVQDDGFKYVYGIPVYNNEYEQATFNIVPGDGIGNINYNCEDNTVSYEKGVDNTVNNNKGRDSYYSSKKLPAYATSFLLTSVLSSDYRDVTGDGVSEDDQGSAIKLNYTKLIDEYHWRFPYSPNHLQPRANYQKGVESDLFDDRGSYSYGSREVYYVHSIESRQYVAVFHTSDREDGYGVLNRDGGKDLTKALQKLDKIELFSKEELMQQGAKAVPIKTVHLEYAYSLCKGVPNHQDFSSGTDYSLSNAPEHGKLTLAKVYFTYGKSKRGKSNPYIFQYADPGHIGDGSNTVVDNTYNASYDPKDVDRWGKHKPHGCSDFKKVQDDYYTSQANDGTIRSNQWKLHTIDLPSGGRVMVEYESDDYAFVQDRRAMNMLKIAEFRSWDSENDELGDAHGNELYDDESKEVYDVVVFDLDEDIVETDPQVARKQLLENYFYDRGHPSPGNENGFISSLKYKVRTSLVQGSNGYEMIEGYADILEDEVGFIPPLSGSPNRYRQAYVRLHHGNWFLDKEGTITSHKKEKDPKKWDIHPISWTAWDFMRFNNPHILMKSPTDMTSDPFEAATELVSVFKGFFSYLREYTGKMRSKGYARECDLDMSWIRLYDSDWKKIGGGSRVKQIAMSDNWHSLSGSSSNADIVNGVYTTEYDYTIPAEPGTEQTAVGISSGVASYEPILGQEENPWKQLELTSIKQTKLPSMNFYFEQPYGESFFARPGITYSRVKVRSKVPDASEGDYNGNGTTMHQFYTTKDFPVKVGYTNVDKERNRQIVFIPFLWKQRLDVHTLSQGYTIEKNDMDGKPRATWYLQEQEVERSNPESVYRYGVKYDYFTNEDKTELVNDVRVMNADGTVHLQECNVDMDVMLDTKSSRDFYGSLDLDFNFDLFGFFPVPTLWPSVELKENTFRAAVMNKVLTKRGIAKSSTTYTNGAAITVENLIFDPLSGTPLVSKQQNEFGTWIYSQNLLAQWAYEGMGGAYKNYRTKLQDLSFDSDNSILSASNLNGKGLSDYLHPGDRVLLYDVVANQGSDAYKERLIKSTPYWVAVKDGKYYLIDVKGEIQGVSALTANDEVRSLNLQVMESGRSNQLGATIGSVLSANEVPYNVDGSFNFDADILNADVVEYKEGWQVYCCGEVDPTFSFGLNVQKSEAALKDLVNRHYLFSTINPYTKHQKGVYRPYKTYIYQSGRNQEFAQAATSEEVLIDKSGFITGFTPFWEFQAGQVQETSAPAWQVLEETTIVGPNGLPLESKNANNVYSASIMGYDRQFQVAAGRNTMLNQMAFDGFEDYTFKRGKEFKVVYPAHFSFEKSLANHSGATLVSNKSHTGQHSLELTLLTANQSSSLEELHQVVSLRDVSCATSPEHIEIIENGDCVPVFKPGAGNYVISAWIQEDAFNDLYSYDRTYIEVTALDANQQPCVVQDADDNPITYKFYPSGNIVDGWQRVFGEFTIHEHCEDCMGAQTDICCVSNTCTAPAYLRVTLGLEGRHGGAFSYRAYLDDLRIFPADALMSSHVYNPETLKMEATLDENNYATFYEYSLDGALERVKRETEKGVITIQETRQNIQK